MVLSAVPDSRPCFLYSVVRRETGQGYVGVSVDPKKRWRRHNWEAKRGCPTHFARALCAYGKEAFEWSLLSEYPSEEAAKRAEVDVIAAGHGYYNLTPGGDGNSNPSPEVRARMSAGQKARGPRSEETKRRMSEAQKGHVVSDEARRNMSLAQKGKAKAPVSEETRAKLSAALKGKKHSAESIAKRAAKIRGRKCPEHSARLKGRNLTPEHAAKLAASSTGRMHTEEAKENMRRAWLLRKQNKIKGAQ